MKMLDILQKTKNKLKSINLFQEHFDSEWIDVKCLFLTKNIISEYVNF